MIRASAKMQDGRTLVFLGVDPANLRRLREGKPIFVDMAELGVDACVVIQFGESLDAIMKSLRDAGIDLPEAEDRRSDPKPSDHAAVGPLNVPGLGPTGRFPEGRLNASDEGEIRIAIASKGSKVILDFGKPVSWLSVNGHQAEEIGHAILQRAATAKASSD